MTATVQRPQRGAPSAQPPTGGTRLPAFEVVSIQPIRQGSLLGFLDIQIGRGPGALTVCEWRLIQQPGQRPWLSAPQRAYTVEGATRYKNLIAYPSAWRDALTECAVRAWNSYESDGVLPQSRLIGGRHE